jgi:CRISPR-associated protein Csm4
MSIWKLVRLKFGRHCVHFGELGIGIEETSERVFSDTLFSAWINAYARLFGSSGVEDLFQRFLDSPYPPVRMSSTFIYQQKNGEFNYYLPRPLKFPCNYPESDDLNFFKTYKKLNYLPLSIWQRWYQGEGFTHSDREELIAATKKSNSSGALHQAGIFDYSKTFTNSQIPKIAVDRVTGATNLYHTGFVQFQWESNGNEIKSLSGLYFLLQFSQQDRELENNLYAALNLLGEEGLGGERSSGAGRFEIDAWEDLPSHWNNLVNFQQGTHHSLISLFWELPLAEGFLENSSYELVERGGWISSPFSGRQLRRQKVRMFVEGSVFTSPPSGQLADVTPREFRTSDGKYNPHPIYRNGVSLSLPIVTA